MHEINFGNIDNGLGEKTFSGDSQKHEKSEVWNNNILMTLFLPTVDPHAEGKLPEICGISLAL